MTRRRVVLPEPEGPRRASSVPLLASRLTLSSAAKLPNRLVTLRMVMLMGHFLSSIAGSVLGRFFSYRGQSARSDFVFQDNLDDQGYQGKQGQNRGEGKRRSRLVILRQLLDAERHRRGSAGNVSSDDGDRAELAHRPGVAEDHAVEQSPFDIRQRDSPKHLPTAGAKTEGRQF